MVRSSERLKLAASCESAGLPPRGFWEEKEVSVAIA